MVNKDKRIKRCTNPTCERYITKYKYKATEKYCSLCGNSLVFVCGDCFDKIEDEGPQHRICARCEAIRADRKEKAAEYGKAAKDMAVKAVVAAPVAVVHMKDVNPKNVKSVAKAIAETAVDVVKKNK